MKLALSDGSIKTFEVSLLAGSCSLDTPSFPPQLPFLPAPAMQVPVDQFHKLRYNVASMLKVRRGAAATAAGPPLRWR
jgi:hypothetical protein